MNKIFENSKVNVAILDQMLVSGVNFVLNIFLARFLGIEDFGTFALLWLCVLFVSSMQLALIIYPMLSLTIMQDDQDCYLDAMFWLQLLFSIMSGVLLSLICIFFGNMFFNVDLYKYAFDISILSILHTFQDFLRRLFFVKGFPRLAIFSDFIAYVGRLAILFVCSYVLPIEIDIALRLIALSSFLSIMLTIKFTGARLVSRVFLWKIAQSNWSFSRWLLGSSALQWLSGNLFVLVASSVVGPFAAGIVRICQNLMGVAHVVFLSMENFVPRIASECFASGGRKLLLSFCKKTIVFTLMFVATFILIVSLFPEFWINLFYGKSYMEYSGFLRWYVFLYIFMALSVVFKMFLRTVGKTNIIFISDCFVAGISLIIASPIITKLKIDGIIVGSAFTMATGSIILYIGCFMFYKRENL